MLTVCKIPSDYEIVALDEERRACAAPHGGLLVVAPRRARGEAVRDLAVELHEPRGVGLPAPIELLDALGPYETLKEVEEGYYTQIDIANRTWGTPTGIACADGELCMSVSSHGA